jgi:hypothetical protein
LFRHDLSAYGTGEFGAVSAIQNPLKLPPFPIGAPSEEKQPLARTPNGTSPPMISHAFLDRFKRIYRKTGNRRALRLLLGHTKMASTVRYLGVELEDALAIAEAVEN